CDYALPAGLPRHMKNAPEDVTPTHLRQANETAEIAKRVLTIAGGTIAGISALTLAGAAWTGAKTFAATSEVVFNALLPLLGTWIGTVLAYYFSRKNFESASQSVERLVTLTADQKLSTLAVAQEMLQADQITWLQLPLGKTPRDLPLAELRAKLKGRVTRLPIVNEKGAVRYIVHQSSLFKLLAERALEGRDNIQQLSLQDLLDDSELRDWVTNIVFVSERVTVADAKRRMEDQRGCQDVIITAAGSRDEPVRGWLTNVDIGRLSK
ncbi:MAG: CBS domain-containing protein, partial [Polyangiales bacterium]